MQASFPFVLHAQPLKNNHAHWISSTQASAQAKGSSTPSTPGSSFLQKDKTHKPAHKLFLSFYKNRGVLLPFRQQQQNVPRKYKTFLEME